MEQHNAVFVDDSHAERERISSMLKIPVFSPDMVETFW